MRIAFSASSPPPRRFARGMSLIEIMVGVAIALVTTVVIFQVFLSSTTSSRTTTSGNEAQIAGNIGMFQLERDLKAAGLGFGTLADAGGGCSVQATNPALSTPTFSFPLVPVLITPGAGGLPDQMDVLYGNSSYLTTGRRYGSASATSKTTVAKGGRAGIQMGDLAVLTNTAVPPTVCEMVEITDNTNADGLTVNHAQGVNYNNFYTGAPVLASRNSAGTPGGLNGAGVLYNLGPQPSLNQWRVANNTLVFTNLLGGGAASSVAEGIVHLKAQYGVDNGAGGGTADDGVISPGEWTAVAPANWSKVLAVRFAVLARSQQMEKTVVSGTPTWVGGEFDMSNIGDWQNYRYRVYESVVAMRNVIWGTSP